MGVAYRNLSSTEYGNALGALLQTPASELHKVSGPMGRRFLSSILGLGFGTLIGRAQFFPVPALDEIGLPSLSLCVSFSLVFSFPSLRSAFAPSVILSSFKLEDCHRAGCDQRNKNILAFRTRSTMTSDRRLQFELGHRLHWIF